MFSIKPAPTVIALFTVIAFVEASGFDQSGENAEVVESEAAVVADEAEVSDAEVRPDRLPEQFERHGRREQERRGPQRRHQGFRKELEKRIDLLRRDTQDGNENGPSGARRMIERLEHELEARRRWQHHETTEHHDVHERHPRRVPDHDQPHDEIHRRMEHMQNAIRHLNEAQLPGIAEQVEQQFEATRRELHAMHDHDHNEVNIPGVLRQVMRDLEELRDEVGRLRETVDVFRDDR